LRGQVCSNVRTRCRCHPREALQAQAAAVDVLGGSLVGACLTDSAVIGGLRRDGHVDVLAAVDARPTHKDRSDQIAQVRTRRTFDSPNVSAYEHITVL
jgi:hypothetical protein